MVGVRRGVRQARVEHNQLGAAIHLAVDDALRVRIEVVPALEVAAHQQDHVGVRVIGARPVEPHPVLVARAPARRADVGVRVVSVDAPGGEHAFGEPVLPRPADVIHDIVRAPLGERRADPRGNVLQRLVPRDARPSVAAARASPLHRVQHAVRVLDLVQRRRALGAVAAPRPGVLGVALQLAHLAGVPVNVGEQAAGRLAVETGGGHEHVAALDAGGPGLRVQFHPVVPPLLRREGGECGAARALVERLAPGGGRGPIGRNAGLVGHRHPHASGTDWPDCT